MDGLGKPLRPPTLKDVQKILEDMSEGGKYEFPAELENAIYRIKQFTREGEDFFAQQSTIDLEKLTHAGLVDLDLSGLPDETFRGLAALSMLQFIKEKMRSQEFTMISSISVSASSSSSGPSPMASSATSWTSRCGSSHCGISSLSRLTILSMPASVFRRISCSGWL